MPYVKFNESKIGSIVRLDRTLTSIAGEFTPGSVVCITDMDPIRGYTFTDYEGNSVAEAGFDGFTVLEK